MGGKLSMTEMQKRLVMSILIGFLSLAWLVPFVTTGVVNNDALMSHLHSVYKPLLYDRDVQQGRVIEYFLSYPLSLILNAGENFYVARIRDYCFIMLSMCSLGFLYYKFFHQFTFSCLSICISLAMLPVTFEHTLPQVYCGFAFYFTIFIWAVLLFLKWIETDKKYFLVLSLFINFYVLFLYEMYITLMPLYLVAAWYALPVEKRELKDIFCKIKYHIFMAAFYLMIYVGMRFMIPSHYEGNAVGSLSLISIGRVLKQLIFASIPGYYWMNAKYRYIFGQYSNYEANFERGGIKSVIMHNVDISMIFFGMILLVALIMILNNICMRKLQNSGMKIVYTVGTATCFVVLPLLPMAVSARYQTSVNESDFISVSAVYFSYLAVSFIISYVIWEIVARFNKTAIFIVVVVVSVSSMAIQLMNHVIENRQQEGFFRVRTIERAFATEVMAQLEGRTVSAGDLYKTIDALAFENEVVTDGYWTLYSRHCGHNVTVLNSEVSENDTQMFYMNEKDGGMLGIRKDSAYYVLTEQKQSEPKAVKINKDQYMIATFDQYTLDSGMYVYSYLIIGDALLPVSGVGLFVGSTWESALKMPNIYDDGFIGMNGDFAIQMGDTGEMTISLYCPFELSGDEEYRIYINNQEMVSSRVEQGVMENTISTMLRNEIVVVHIETNFIKKPDNGDERELSMLISGVYTE